MYLTVLLLLSVVVGETYSGKVTITGIGEIKLPEGKWTVEHAVLSEKKTNSPDVFVFKKAGDRLERLTFQKFGPHIALPISAYFDSIGDSTSNGIPIQLLANKNDHDTAHILGPLHKLQITHGKTTCLVSSYVYTSETKDPWMSHAFVCDCDGWVLVGVHASPYAISPETVADVFLESRFEKGNVTSTTK